MKLQDLIGQRIAIRTEGRADLVEKLYNMVKTYVPIDYFINKKYLFLQDCHLQWDKDDTNFNYPEISITEIDELREENGMKLSDLKAGKHLVVTRDGTKMLVMDGWFQIIEYDNPRSLKEWASFNYFTEDLKNNGYRGESFDIVKVYEIFGGYFNGTISFNSCCKLIWEELQEVELTMDEIAEKFGVDVSKLKIKIKRRIL